MQALRIFYSALYGIALLLMLPYELMRRHRSVRGRWLRERFGLADLEGKSESALLWVHAVSVGETIAASTFIKEFLLRHPGSPVLLTTVTDTGQRVARERLGSTCHIRYVPFDLAFAVRSTIRRTRPAALVIMETELWPNMIAEAARAGIPVAIMNGRISEKSFGRYKHIRWALGGMLRSLSLLCMQDGVYAERVIALGAEPSRVHKVGNFKFDIEMKEGKPLAWTSALKSPVLMAGSTHRGEEEMLVEVYRRLLTEFPALDLVLVPRHPERFKEVEGLVKSSGLAYRLRSGLKGDEALEGTIVILDSVGELSAAYRACDIAVVGGSFIPHGGQNPLEPAYWAKPVLCGPHMFNFPFITEFYAAGAARESEGAEGLYSEARKLLLDPGAAQAMGLRGQAILESNRGAVLRALELFEPLWRQHGAA